MQRAAVCGQRASRRSAGVQDAFGRRGEGGGGGWGDWECQAAARAVDSERRFRIALGFCPLPDAHFECCAAAQLLPFLYIGDGETGCFRRWVGLEKEVRGWGGARRGRWGVPAGGGGVDLWLGTQGGFTGASIDHSVGPLVGMSPVPGTGSTQSAADGGGGEARDARGVWNFVGTVAPLSRVTSWRGPLLLSEVRSC